MKKINYIYILLIISSIMFSCEEIEDAECTDYDFSSCDTWEPFSAELVITLTIDDENTNVPVTIYEGRLEDDVIIKQCTIQTTKLYYDVPLDQFYTVKAEYKKGNNTIYCVDGEEMEKKSSEVCDSTCWEIKGGYMDVRLKY